MVALCLVARLSGADEATKAEEKPAAASEKEETTAKAADEKAQAPEVIKLEKTGKLAPVLFQHKTHAENPKIKGGCKDCHEGENPLFEQKRSEEGMKMAAMHAGKLCGACHNGKKAFATKSGCMKCHKKEEKKGTK
ncbi:MAG: hypothetical protein HY554_07085 [Elusimicrobia bacterium]|nr:hypothetical protein [Elusimicrobiota bacterium]